MASFFPWTPVLRAFIRVTAECRLQRAQPRSIGLLQILDDHPEKAAGLAAGHGTVVEGQGQGEHMMDRRSGAGCYYFRADFPRAQDGDGGRQDDRPGSPLQWRVSDVS